MRKIYKQNPLKEVLLQFSFPTLLTIDQNEPANFQNAIIDLFPYYSEGNSDINNIILGPTIESTKMNKTIIHNHFFDSEDLKTRIILNNNSITISTKDYKGWDFFRNMCYEIVKKFINVYNPPFCNRIGLRYVNVITKQDYDLNEYPWSAIINSEYLAHFIDINEEDYRLLSIKSEIFDKYAGIINKENYGFVRLSDNGDTGFLADSDYIKIGNFKWPSVEELFDCLHSKSKGYIEKIATELLKEKMGLSYEK